MAAQQANHMMREGVCACVCVCVMEEEGGVSQKEGGGEER